MLDAAKITRLCALTSFLTACGDAPATAPTADGAAAFAVAGRGSVEVQRKVDTSLTPLALYPVDADPTTSSPFKQNLVQTFTAGRTGLLDYIQMPIACAEGVGVRIQIRSGGPAGAILVDQTHDPATVVARGDFVLFQIGVTGVPVVAGNIYGIFLASEPSGATPETTCSIVAGPLGDSYGGGQAYVNNPGFSPYWIDTELQTSSGTFVMGDLPFIARIS